MNQDTKVFFIIFLAVFLGTSFGTWQTDTKYKVEFVSATSTLNLQDYLTSRGEEGWKIFSFRDFSDGRQYVFTK